MNDTNSTQTPKNYRIRKDGKYVLTCYKSIATALKSMGFDCVVYKDGSTYSFENTPLLIKAIDFICEIKHTNYITK